MKKPAPYLDLIRKVLSGLAKERMGENAWIDSESEEQARESQVFKIGECLRPFYLAANEAPRQFGDMILPKEILIKDTDFFLKQIGKTGFFPSPYSQIPGFVDQYTDFASFTLEFCGLVHHFWKGNTAVGNRLAEASTQIAERALEFLLNPDHCLIDDSGCRWAGTRRFKRQRRTEEFYTDVYFTSVVVLALNKATDNPALSLNSTRKEQIRSRIQQSTKWISERFDSKLITGDEAKANRKLLYTTWGLHALAATHKVHENIVSKRILESITNAYIDVLREAKQFTQQQEYLTVLSEEVDQENPNPLYYEDRSGVGGILLTLAILSDIPDLEHVLDRTGFPRLLERVINAVLALRNPGTGLWYNNQLILSIHSYLTEAFLTLHRRADGFGSRFEVSGYMVRAAVKETLMDESVINGLQQAVYDRLLRFLEAADQGRTIDEVIAATVSTNGGENRTDLQVSKRAQSKRRRSRSRSQK